MRFDFIKSIIISIALPLFLFTSCSAVGCTRVLLTNKNQAVMVGRNMDWLDDMDANLWIYPRGIDRNGMILVNSMGWTAKYGSIVAAVFDNIRPITTDGMNEKGFAAHLLSLSESNYGKRDENIPGMSILLWAQFYLDNFQTVAEAVQFTETNPFQIVPFFDPKVRKWINLHLALEDASGDSAIIEYTDGKPHVYHDPNFAVLTNSPTFDKQLENLKNYKVFGGDKPLPGRSIAPDRFVRASYYLKYLPEATTLREELTNLFSVIQNVSQPYGVQNPERLEVSKTIWRVVADLTHRTYYFNSSARFNIFWVDLNKFNLQAGEPIRKLDLINTPELTGEVSGEFQLIPS